MRDLNDAKFTGRLVADPEIKKCSQCDNYFIKRPRDGIRLEHPAVDIVMFIYTPRAIVS